MNEILPTIRKNVPCPPRGWRPNLKSDVLKRMEIDDSFHVDTDRERHVWLSTARRCGITIVTRKENGVGWGVWKVK